MNKLNQALLTIALVVGFIAMTIFAVSAVIREKAEADCMAYKVPHAQVIGLTVYCGGIGQGSEMYIPISQLKDYYENKESK